MSVPPTAVQPSAPTGEPCAACGSPLADDQRYCLQCGELRRGARRSLPAILRGSIHGGTQSGIVATSSLSGAEWRPSLAASLAGIACLLLAMGVGVLIGRGGGQTAAAPAPITVAAGPAGAGATPATTAAFAGDWPAGKDGWTIALNVLPKAATQPDAVAAAKTAATGNGAAAVGALDSDSYPSLTAGSYLVYSGVYDAERAAATARAALKATFPEARVVRVAATASTSPGSSSRGSKGTSSPAKKKTSAPSDTKKAFEDSKKAPKTVGTGGKPPPTDNKPAGAGSDVQEIG